MEFGIQKCAKVTIKRGKQVSSSNIPLGKNVAIQNLDQEAYYKYLGVEEAGGISHNKMKEKIRKEFYRRTRKILQSQLNSKNKVSALNSLAIPVVTYSYNIINWNQEDLKKLDIKVQKLLTMKRNAIKWLYDTF